MKAWMWDKVNRAGVLFIPAVVLFIFSTWFWFEARNTDSATQYEQAAFQTWKHAEAQRLAESQRELNTLTPSEHLDAASQALASIPQETQGDKKEMVRALNSLLSCSSEQKQEILIQLDNEARKNLFSELPSQRDLANAKQHLTAIPSTAPEAHTATRLLRVVDEAQQLLEVEQRLERNSAQQASREAQLEQRQRERDHYAMKYSYLPTTLRVETDMDSSWLPQEERTCQTYPDEKGRIAIVTCNTERNESHNIPVKFWGGIDRKVVSQWKCRKEKFIADEFVCRALN